MKVNDFSNLKWLENNSITFSDLYGDVSNVSWKKIR